MTDPEPALLLELTKARARIAELEAERDEYWRRFNWSQDANKNLVGMVRDATAHVEELRGQRDEARAEVFTLTNSEDAVRVVLDRLVKAAEAWTAKGVGISVRSKLNAELVAAVKAWRAAQWPGRELES